MCIRESHNVLLHSQIPDVSLLGNALAEHNVKLRLLEGRVDLVLHHLDPNPVSHYLAPLLQVLNAAHIQTHGGVELQSPASCGSLRVAKHNANLLAKLVNKNHDAVGLADHRCELAQGLSCLLYTSRCV